MTVNERQGEARMTVNGKPEVNELILRTKVEPKERPDNMQ